MPRKRRQARSRTCVNAGGSESKRPEVFGRPISWRLVRRSKDLRTDDEWRKNGTFRSLHVGGTMRWGKKNVNSDTVPAEAYSEVIGEHQPCVRAISRTEGWRYAWERAT